MFRRRAKPERESRAAVSRQAARRSKKRSKAPPPGPLSASELPADSSDEAAIDESSEPWYRQSGPLFDESFNDSPPSPAPQPPDGETGAEFTPPLPADPAAMSSVPMIQRVGQVTDPGPLSEEMLGTFRPTPGDDEDGDDEDEPAAEDEPASEPPAGDWPAAEDAPADPSAEPETEEDTEEQSPWMPPMAATPRTEPGISFDDDGHPHDPSEPLIDFDDDDLADAAPEEIDPDDDAVAEDVSEGESTLPAEAPSSEIAPAQHEPPMVVPVRGYYIARTEDTLRSVAAQFLNAPERWAELRALNAAYPGIADLDPDELVPEGAALALPGDPLPWGRPDPVYLWTLAETFLFTAWGREPSPEEVVPFWRGLTQGALPEGEQSPLGIELPDVAQIATRSAEGDTEAPVETEAAPDADVPPMPPAAFEMPAATEPVGDIEDVYRDIEVEADRDEPIADEAVADEALAEAPGDEEQAGAEPEPEPAEPLAPEAEEAESVEPVVDLEPEAPAEFEPVTSVVEDLDPLQALLAEAPDAGVTFEIEPVDEAPPAEDLEPEAPAAAEAVEVSVDIVEEIAEEAEAEDADVVDAPPSVVDTAELAGLVQAVEAAVEEAGRSAIEAEDDTIVDAEIVDAEIVDDVEPEPAYVEPELPDAEPLVDESLLVEPPAAEPPLPEAPAPAPPPPEAPLAEPLLPEVPPAPPPVDAPPPVYAEPPAAPPLEPPPTFEEWIDEEPAVPPPLDPSAPYAGMPGAGTAEAPPRPPEAEAPRVPHFMPSVTGTTPGGLTTAAQSSPVGRSLAGTAVGDAMLLWQLARRRRQSRRAAGVPDAIEQSLLQSAGSEALELIEAAMRHLYAVTVGQQRPKPSVLAVRSGTYGFEVLLDGPVPTPPGWRSASGGFVLELPQGVTARDLGAIGHGPSLCPALVPVGSTFEGPLLLNLEQLGCLAVSGPSSPAASLLSAIVGTLGSSPMAGHLRITAVGFEHAAGMIGWEAVSFATYDSPELETLLANAYRPGEDMIDLLVIGPGNDLLIQRAGQVATAPESRLSLVGATSAVSARWPWRIHVDDTGTAVVHPISITMTAARAVPLETLAQFGEAQFGSAAGNIDPAGLR